MLGKLPGGNRLPEDYALMRGEVDAARNAERTAGAKLAAYGASFAALDESAAAEEESENTGWSQRFANAWDEFKDGFKALLTGILFDVDPIRKATLTYVLKDTELYVKQRQFRCATNATIAVALKTAKAQERPVIVVAHSMGTLVTMDYLVRYEEASSDVPESLFEIARFISLGSQLGLENFMREFLYQTTPRPDKFLMPKAFSEWVNLRGQNDYVSPRNLSGLYDPGSQPFIELNIATTAGRPHDIDGYLANKAVAAAIAYAWCQGFQPASRPSACANILDVRAGDGGASLVVDNVSAMRPRQLLAVQ